MAAKKIAKKQVASESPEPKTPRKVAAKKAAKKAANAPSESLPKSAPRPSIDSIARAAYLNYRRRVEQGLPGDSHGDWLEAENQLHQ